MTASWSSVYFFAAGGMRSGGGNNAALGRTDESADEHSGRASGPGDCAQGSEAGTGGSTKNTEHDDEGRGD